MLAEDEKTLASLILALAVILALFFPQVSHGFEPYLLPSLFCVMVFSLFPFARLDGVELTRIHPAVLALVAWQQFILPALVMVVGQFFDIERQLLYFILVTVTSGSLFASPTLVQLMGLDQKMAVQTVVISTIAAPASIYLVFGYLESGNLELHLGSFALRMVVFLIVPIGIFLALRTQVSKWSESGKDRLDTIGRWGSVLALVAFCFALEAQVTDTISDDPQKVIDYLFIAIAVAVAIGLTTRIVMARFGMRAAATAMVLASFRNVGLTFGLVGSIAGPELAVYVGICQIPMFFSPLLFDLFVGKNRVRTWSQTAAPETAPAGADAGDEVIRPGSPGGAGPAPASAGSVSVYQRPSHMVMPAGQYGAATALDLRAFQEEQALAAEPSPEQKSLEDYLTEGLEVTREDARALLHRLHHHYKQIEAQAKPLAEAVNLNKRSAAYIAGFLALSIAAVAGMVKANKYFSPMLFDQNLVEQVAEAHSKGRNFGVFDLNINIRDLRDATIARMDRTPEVIVLGASHWQEAHVELLEGRDFYNSHVHRDYYEDMMAVTEMWLRHDRLPKEMIITIRDNLLTPVKDRTDFLWYPGIKYYRDFARRIGMEPHSQWETLPVNTWRELVSLPILWSQATRQLAAPVQPHATDERHFETLDTLLPGGSILWSAEHQRLFDQDRARREALAFAEARRNDPPKIDPKGIAHMEALFDFLVEKGVKVTLAAPQFNPIFWDAVQDSPYMDGLRKIEELTANWARKYGFRTMGGFAPESVGCTADMYIDAEHGNPTCLGMLLSQYGERDFDFSLRDSGARTPKTFDGFKLRGTLGG